MICENENLVSYGLFSKSYQWLVETNMAPGNDHWNLADFPIKIALNWRSVTQILLSS